MDFRHSVGWSGGWGEGGGFRGYFRFRPETDLLSVRSLARASEAVDGMARMLPLARIVHRWMSNIGRDDRSFGTHSLRRSTVAQLYRKTGNLRAVQLLLGHPKIETTMRYLVVEVEHPTTCAADRAPGMQSARNRRSVPRRFSDIDAVLDGELCQPSTAVCEWNIGLPRPWVNLVGRLAQVRWGISR